MVTEAKDVDELEALLAGLNEDDLDAAMSISKSSGLSEEELAELAALEALDEAPQELPKPPAKSTRKKRLQPLPVEEPKVEEPKVEDDDLASLSELNSEPTPVYNNENGLTNQEILAEKVLETLVTLSEEFSVDCTGDEFSAIVDPIIAKIGEDSTIEQIEKDLRQAFIKNAPTPISDEPKAEVKAPVAEVVIDSLPSTEPDVIDLGDGEISVGTSSSDAELDALLASIPAEVAPLKAANPTPAPTSSTAPIAVTPTKKSGGLNTFIDPDQLQKDLSFTESSINEGMTRQAALFAHYARLSADATYQSDRAKQQVELLEAQLNQKFRDAMVMSGTKFTEKSIDALVIQDSGYQAAQERAHEARAIASMVSSAADSFRHRKDMLIQVGADLRLEKQGELRMKEHPGQRALEGLTSK